VNEAKRVMVVDDDGANRILIKAMLEKSGYRVMLANSGPACLEQLEAERPDLILLDYMMPGLDGPEVARRVRARPTTRDVPVILLTTLTDERNIELAFQSGADDYLTKPINRPLLIARVQTALRRQLRDALVRELEEADEVQRSLLPSVPMMLDGWIATGALAPCGHIGGDAFDVIDGPNQKKIAVLLDVSGHGTAAALVAASVCSQLRSLAATRPLSDCVDEIHARLSSTASGKYACMIAIEIDGPKATIINAGLPPLCLVRGGEVLALIESCRPPIGLWDADSGKATHLALERGDRLVAMTDGLTEPFGSADEVTPTLAKLGILGSSVQPIDRDASRLLMEIRALFGLKQPDDATILILERTA
jgi:phosphoserine phosphatase RsbU/P